MPDSVIVSYTNSNPKHDTPAHDVPVHVSLLSWSSLSMKLVEQDMYMYVDISQTYLHACHLQ